MKKYNLSDIMKKAWEIKKTASNMIFGECLKLSWALAKKALCKAASKIKFEDGMTVVVDGYERTLTRWTKGGYDRVYINGGSRRGDGFVDIKRGYKNLRGNLTYQNKIADMILDMVF